MCFSSLWCDTFARGSALKRIGDRGFRCCKELKVIEIPDGVEEIGEGCFAGCDGGFVMTDPLIVRKDGMCGVCCFRSAGARSCVKSRSRWACNWTAQSGLVVGSRHGARRQTMYSLMYRCYKVLQTGGQKL